MDTAAGIRLLHTSDWQLGMRRWYLGEQAGRFEQDRLDAVARLGEIARERDCALMVVAGDVFEHNSVERRTVMRCADVLREMPVPVWLLPGNHDALVADSVLRRIAGEVEGVHVLDGSTPVPVAPGVELVGAPLTVRHPDRDLLRAALDPLEPTDAVRIAVGHGATEVFGSEPGPAHIDVDHLGELRDRGVVDYVALGDTHSTREVAPGVWYSGSPEPTDFAREDGGGESDSGNALVVEVAKGRCEVERVPVGRWRFRALGAELATAADVDSLLDRLNAMRDKPRTVIRHALAGTLPLAEIARLERGLEDAADSFAGIHADRSGTTLAPEPDGADLDALDLPAYARAALAELMAAGETEAVNLLFRLGREEARR